MPTLPSEIVLRRRLKAGRNRVFQAWTDPALMTRWLFPAHNWTVTVKSDLKVGGSYRLAMRDPDGVLHVQFGVYREIVPVSRLVFTWSCPDLAVSDSLVTVELDDDRGGTALTLTHELLERPEVRRSHEEGWTGCLGSLEQFLDTNE
jgi:uncharacterized protein YndB with AHSA1/START domain